MIKVIKRFFKKGEKELGERLKKLPDYRLMIDCICQKYGLNYEKPYLYFRHNKRHREIANESSKAYS